MPNKIQSNERATQSSVSCLRTLWYIDWSSQESKYQPSSSQMTCCATATTEDNFWVIRLLDSVIANVTFMTITMYTGISFFFFFLTAKNHVEFTLSFYLAT